MPSSFSAFAIPVALVIPCTLIASIGLQTGAGFCRPMPTDRTTPVSSTRRDAIRTSRSRRPSEYLKQLYFDSLIFSPEALRHLAAQVGINQIMLGSDHPYPWQDHRVDHIMAATSLSDDDNLRYSGATPRRYSA
jgi:hypothetical protein